MKQLFIFILFLPLLGCGNIIKNKQTSIDFNCPRVFFSSDDRIYIDNSISLDDITIKAEFNNYAINKKCQQQENIAVIPLDILIVAKPMDNLEDSLLSFPILVLTPIFKLSIVSDKFTLLNESLSLPLSLRAAPKLLWASA